MIAKTTTGSSFDSALGYGAADLSENQRQHKQAQVVLLDCYNLISSEWRGMAAEMSAVAQGSRCQTPVWHTSLSVGAGESLSGDQWRAAARQYCVSMGADPQQHQVAIFQHHDTAHPHVHIYINRVRLDDGPALHTGHNYARNVKATRHIEQSLALTPLPDQRTSLKDHSPAIQANRQELATLVGQVMSQTKPGTFDELATDLAGHGVQMKVIANAKGGYGVSFKVGDNPPAKGSAIGYKYRHLAQQLDTNRAEYQAEIERLKRDLEKAENKPAETKEIEIIKWVEITKEVEVIQPNPADLAEIARLKNELAQKSAPVEIHRPDAEQQAEIKHLREQRDEAYEKRDQLRDAYLNKPATTVLKEVEVVREVVKSDPLDQITINQLTRQLKITQDAYDQQQTKVAEIGVTVREVVETNGTLQDQNQQQQLFIQQQQRLYEEDRKAIVEKYNDLAARFNALQQKLRTLNAGASTEQIPTVSAPANKAIPSGAAATATVSPNDAKARNGQKPPDTDVAPVPVEPDFYKAFRAKIKQEGPYPGVAAFQNRMENPYKTGPKLVLVKREDGELCVRAGKNQASFQELGIKPGDLNFTKMDIDRLVGKGQSQGRSMRP